MSKQSPSRLTSYFSTLKSRVVAALSDEVPEGDVKSFFSRDGRFALLSDGTDANDRANEVYVEFPNAASIETPLEIYVGRRRVVSGVWSTAVWADDQKLAATGPWQTLCEEIDNDAAFVERLLPLTGGRSFSRRLLVAFNEGLFLNVDVLFAKDGERAAAESTSAPNASIRRSQVERTPTLRIRSRLPLDLVETSVGQNGKDREIAFYDAASASTKSSQPFARLFSLSIDARGSETGAENFALKSARASDAVLELEARRAGGSLCVATLFDWNANRALRPFSIDGATVGEALRAVGPDSAIGRQILLGRERFVLYVSTSRRPAIRSILSRNLLSDFMFGKFFIGRGVEPIVDVDAPFEL